MKDDSTAFVGSMPHYYDTGLGPVLFAEYARRLGSIVAAYAPATVLEVSAGTGISSRALKEALPGADLTITDLSPEMLALAQPRVPSATFRPADGQDLPFDDGTFDVVACQFGAMFFPDLDAAFGEALRVLKPGGHYVFSTWDGRQGNPYAGMVDDLLAEDYPTDRPPFFQVPFRLNDIDAIARRVQRAGFGDVRVTLSGDAPIVQDWATFATAMINANQTAAQITARGGDPAAFEARLLSAFEAHYGPAPAAMPMQAIFFEATKP